MTTRTAPRPFTGWHMTGILVGFFLVVMAVNFAMARFALSSFGGTVVENSYVASQHYNELAAQSAEAQDRLGWRAFGLARFARGTSCVTRGASGRRAARGSKASKATVHHPLGSRRTSPALVVVEPAAGGGMRSARIRWRQGRWRLELAVRHGRRRGALPEGPQVNVMTRLAPDTALIERDFAVPDIRCAGCIAKLEQGAWCAMPAYPPPRASTSPRSACTWRIHARHRHARPARCVFDLIGVRGAPDRRGAEATSMARRRRASELVRAVAVSAALR
jgi:nitrogen fixation protein FixH